MIAALLMEIKQLAKTQAVVLGTDRIVLVSMVGTIAAAIILQAIVRADLILIVLVLIQPAIALEVGLIVLVPLVRVIHFPIRDLVCLK